MRRCVVFWAPFVLFALVACGGGGGSSAPSTLSAAPTATPAPTSTPTSMQTSPGIPAWTSTQHTNYVAFSYGENPPQSIAIFAPGQSTASTTITFNGCCIYAIAFDAQANLIVSTIYGGLFFYPPGSTTSTKSLPAQGGTSLAVSQLGDIAIGGYNSGPSVAVYPNESSSAMYDVPGAPAFGGLAFSPSGELAVPMADGTVETFPHGSTVANRTLPVDLIGPGVGHLNEAVVAYDGLGNLALSSPFLTTVSIYAPGSTSPSYTVSGFNSVESLVFDATNRLIVGNGSSIEIFAAGSSTLVKTISTASESVALAVDASGDIAQAGNGLPSHIYQANGNVVTLNNLTGAQGVAISP